MDFTWSEFFQLFWKAIAAALLAGGVCPLVGAFLLVRRTSFYGVALPQFAAAGVVLGFVLLPWWVEHVGLGGLDVSTALGDVHAAMNYHLAWAALFTFAGLAALSALGRRAGEEPGRVAAAFAIASALTVLFGHFSATGASFVYELLRGEILAMGTHELETVAVLFGLVLLLVLWFRHGLVLVSYDPETARVLGVRTGAHELLLAVLVGVTVSIGTMTFGPVLLFGILVLPPLAARAWARSMRAFLALSSAFGLASAAGGLALSKVLDLPTGPAVVACAALALVPGAAARRWGR